MELLISEMKKQVTTLIFISIGYTVVEISKEKITYFFDKSSLSIDSRHIKRRKIGEK